MGLWGFGGGGEVSEWTVIKDRNNGVSRRQDAAPRRCKDTKAWGGASAAGSQQRTPGNHADDEDSKV